MLDPSPMIEFLKLRACLVRIKGCHALKWGMCSYSNTEQQYGIVARQRTSVLFKLSLRGVTLEQVAWCAAYFGKLAILFGCYCPFVFVSQPSLT